VSTCKCTCMSVWKCVCVCVCVCVWMCGCVCAGTVVLTKESSSYPPPLLPRHHRVTAQPDQPAPPPRCPANHFDVFISHNWGAFPTFSNHERVVALADTLIARGLRVWVDRNHECGPGAALYAYFMACASVVVVCVTRTYAVVASDARGNSCQREYARALEAPAMLLVAMEPGLDNAQTRSDLHYQGPIVDCSKRDDPDAIITALAALSVVPDTAAGCDSAVVATHALPDPVSGTGPLVVAQDGDRVASPERAASRLSEEIEAPLPPWNDSREPAPACARAHLLLEAVDLIWDEEEESVLSEGMDSDVDA
jgi:hypothetical protein